LFITTCMKNIAPGPLRFVTESYGFDKVWVLKFLLVRRSYARDAFALN